MTRTAAVLAAIALLAVSCAGAQEPLLEWPFDDDTGTWQSIDPAAQLSITDDENLVREGGAGVAEFSYSAAGEGFTGVGTEITGDLTEAKSLHFWIRTSDPTIVLVSASETDGSQYMHGFYSLADRWQEVALDLSEFQLDDDSTDENGQLDGAQLGGLALIDATGFLAAMAAGVPFIDLPELGPRMFWLDDAYIDAEAIAPRWEVIDIDGARAVRLDSFESTPLHWVLIAGNDTELDYTTDFRTDGEFSLQISYDIPQGKLLGLLTGPGNAPIGGATKLRLALLSENATTVLVGLKEKDESEYSAMIQLQPGEEMSEHELAIAEFAIMEDDGEDENGKLDVDQVTELTIVDVSNMMGEGVGFNTLWIDDIVFID